MRSAVLLYFTRLLLSNKMSCRKQGKELAIFGLAERKSLFDELGVSTYSLYKTGFAVRRLAFIVSADQFHFNSKMAQAKRGAG